MLRSFLFICFFCVSIFAIRAQVSEADLTAQRCGADSIRVTYVVRDSKLQLASLMQGLKLSLNAQHQVFVFPSAAMVRSKLKHHPNEVKAMMRKDSANVEVKPDLMPLIDALSDTTALFIDSLQHSQQPSRAFSIKLEREAGLLSYTAILPFISEADSISITISSTPGELSNKREFNGRRLSSELAPQPNGLGEASMGNDDKKRTLFVNKTIYISNN